MTIRNQIINASVYHACHSKYFFLFFGFNQVFGNSNPIMLDWFFLQEKSSRGYTMSAKLCSRFFPSDIDRMHFNFLCSKILGFCIFLFSSFQSLSSRDQ